jgi:hypothetical protein
MLLEHQIEVPHTHGKLKTEMVVVLGQQIKRGQLGESCTDSNRVSCPAAELSVEPDLVFDLETKQTAGK